MTSVKIKGAELHAWAVRALKAAEDMKTADKHQILAEIRFASTERALPFLKKRDPITLVEAEKRFDDPDSFEHMYYGEGFRLKWRQRLEKIQRLIDFAASFFHEEIDLGIDDYRMLSRCVRRPMTGPRITLNDLNAIQICFLLQAYCKKNKIEQTKDSAELNVLEQQGLIIRREKGFEVTDKGRKELEELANA